MEKYLAKIEQKHYGIVTFFITVTAMYVMLSYEQVLSTGKYVILEGDLLQQYIPFIKMLARDIIQGENIWFSWSLSMGMNTSLCYAYYALSPFNLLYLIFFNVDEAIITAIIIILKTALAAAFFQNFCRKVLNCPGVESIVFSVFYAMCSFNLLYNVMIISWMDALYILPLLCTLLVGLCKEGKWKVLLLTYAYLFVTQFYMAYIVGIFSFLFFCFVLVCIHKKEIKDIFGILVKYVATVLGAIAMTSVVWLPVLLFLQGNKQESFATLVSEVTPLTILGNMYWGQAQGYDGVYPYIYCGIPILFLVPLFFANKNVAKREKVCATLMFLFFLVCMLIPAAYAFIHAFEEPDKLGFRFAFLWSFVCCVIACKQSIDLKKQQKFFVYIETIALIILYIFIFVFRNKEYDSQAILPIFILVANVVWIIIWCMLFFFVASKKVKGMTIAFNILFLTVAEVITNGYSTYLYAGADTVERHYDIYRNSIVQGLEQIENIEDKESFYRVRYLNEYVHNSDAWYGYHSLSDFNSAINTNLQSSMEKLGFYTGTSILYDVGITPVTEMLFGVKYEVEGISPYIMAMDIPAPSVTTNPYALELGYMTEVDILSYSLENKDVFYNMNSLLSVMTGDDINCFEAIQQEKIDVTIENAVLEEYENGIRVIFGNNLDECGYVTYNVPISGNKMAYVQFQRDVSINASNEPLLLNGYENTIYDIGKLSVSYAKEMMVNGDDYEVVIKVRPTDVPITYRQANFCYYNEDELIKAYDILSQNQMVIREYGNTHIDAYVTVPEERTVLFTSIPYDEGWTVYVDGVETQTHAVVGDAFLALELEPGYHDLEFEYEAPGARMGMTVSGVSVGLYAGCILIEYMIKRKRKAKEGTIEPDVEDRTE